MTDTTKWNAATLRERILQLAAENDKLRAAVERVRAVHSPDALHAPCDYCAGGIGPCPTLRALEETP